MKSNFLRIVDANINRYKEGIRVVEDMYRYIHNNHSIASSLKSLRHIKLPISNKELLFQSTRRERKEKQLIKNS